MPALLKTTQIQEPSSATVNLTLSTSGGVTVGQNLTVTGTTTLTGTPTLTGAVLAAGTASVAPLDFTAGTNLTTAIPGAVEYDGKVFYGTPQGTQRGVISAEQFFALNSGLAGSNATGAQSIFGVGATLSASTQYEFELNFIQVKTAGTTSHTISIGFGGTATINNIFWQGMNNYGNATFPNAVLGGPTNFTTNSASALVVTAAIASTTAINLMLIKGIVSINAGGTFIPQYTLSAAPGGAYTTQAGGFIKIKPIGASGANISVGTWA